MKFLHYLILPLLALTCGGIWQFGIRHAESVPEHRAEASVYLRALDFEDYEIDIRNSGNGVQVWGLRAEAEQRVLSAEFISAVQFIQDTPQLAALQEAPGKNLASGANLPRLAPLFVQDGTASPRLFAAMPQDWEDAIDMNGQPLRWRLSENLLAGYSLLRPSRPSAVESPKSVARAPAPARIPRMTASARAAHYREIVNNFARRYNLSSDLVMAIIHSESDFSPALVSNKSAMGLMQLLPSTASGEVHRFLYGKRGQVSFEQLRIPEINIRYGTAYLHILLNRYFANVKNRVVQEACAIASYNMGPNRFLRLYGSNNDSAIAKINSMNEEVFLADLLRRLPVRETRAYVEKVRRMKQYYSSLP